MRRRCKLKPAGVSIKLDLDLIMSTHFSGCRDLNDCHKGKGGGNGPIKTINSYKFTREMGINDKIYWRRDHC